MLDLITFGVWSLICVLFGARLQHRKQAGVDPIAQPAPKYAVPKPVPVNGERKDEAKRVRA